MHSRNPTLIFLLSMLLVSLFSTLSQTNAIADTTPPVLNSIGFSESTIMAGDNFTVWINVTDAESGVNKVELAVLSPSGNYIFKDFVKYNSSSSLWEKQLSSDPMWNGSYRVHYVKIYDNQLNVLVQTHGFDFTSPILTILADGLIDTAPPVLISATLPTSPTHFGGMVFKVQIALIDDGSGVARVSIDLWSYVSHTSTFTVLAVPDVELSYNSTSEKWETLIGGEQTQHLRSESLVIRTIRTWDNAGNWIMYDDRNGNYAHTTILPFNNDDADWNGPEVNYNSDRGKYSVFTDRMSYADNDTVTVFVPNWAISDETGVREAIAEMTRLGDHHTIVARSDMTYDVDRNIWITVFQLNEYFQGIHVIQNIHLTDQVGNVLSAKDLNDGVMPYFFVYDPDIDLDDDNIADQWEENYGYNSSDPLDAYQDPDGDGLINLLEYQNGINPEYGDSDKDGIWDGQEVLYLHLNPFYQDTDFDLIFDMQEDTDGDGLSNEEEFFTYTSNPSNVDSDGDCLYDGFEVEYAGLGLDPIIWDASNGDDDSDGLNLLDEFVYGTSPILPDTDNDNLTDYNEIFLHRTNPLVNDTDGDLLYDALEIDNNLNALSNDTDRDGLVDSIEFSSIWNYTTLNGTLLTFMTDPTLPDTDFDGLGDYIEVMVLGTSGNHSDTDGDLLSDYEEFIIHSSNPLLNDSDGDTLTDRFEIFVSNTNVLSNDTDKDGLVDQLEIFVLLTNPLSNDTDGDGLLDYAESYNSSSSPLTSDTDEDGLNDLHEHLFGTLSNTSDTDNDLMPDYYEYHHQLNGSLNDANHDPDGDNLTHLFEYFNGTDHWNADGDQDLVNDYWELLNGTNPWLNDTDYDGLGDGYEIAIGTNPLLPDSDLDALPDYDEIFLHQSDPRLYDTDDDNLNDYEEIMVYLTNHNTIDTDNDTLRDDLEVLVFLTDPLNKDGDNDTIDDPDELYLGTNPNDADSDNDGLNDGVEVSLGTNPMIADSDHDGLLDGDELSALTDPLLNDSDADYLLDGFEVHTLTTDPNSNDTDEDIMPDGYEFFTLLDPMKYDADKDPDEDNLWNLGEYLLGTDPHDPDTDKDGYFDGYEIEQETDPLDPSSHPNPDMIEGVINQPLMTGGAVMALVASGFVATRKGGV